MEFEYEGKVYPFEYFIDYVSEPEVMEPTVIKSNVGD